MRRGLGNMQVRILGALEAVVEEQLPDRWVVTREHVRITETGVFRDQWQPCPQPWVEGCRTAGSAAAWLSSFKRAARKLRAAGHIEITVLTGIIAPDPGALTRSRPHMAVRLTVDPDLARDADQLRAEAWEKATRCAEQWHRAGAFEGGQLESDLRWLDWYRQLSARDTLTEAVRQFSTR
ncbi:hypothetical protein [Nocardia fluminea]|uniref:hypothetical protein n=1 Tax=Nocardia fluminea TaxID=134984 RepID=UPI003D120608